MLTGSEAGKGSMTAIRNIFAICCATTSRDATTRPPATVVTKRRRFITESPRRRKEVRPYYTFRQGFTSAAGDCFRNTFALPPNVSSWPRPADWNRQRSDGPDPSETVVSLHSGRSESHWITLSAREDRRR